LSTLNHGIYILKVRVVGKISGQNNAYIYSNYLTHKLVYNIADGTNPLLGVLLPERAEQYSNIPISYLFSTSAEDTNDYTLKVYIDQEEKAALTIKPNLLGVYNLYFEETGTYMLRLTIVEAAQSYEEALLVQSYTGELPVISPTRSDLMLYLTPRGKTNDSLDRDTW